MKNFAAFALLLSLSLGWSGIGKAEEPCNTFKDADKKLNEVYSGILEKHKADKVFVEKLKKAQRAWIMFRDAELEALYPVKNKQVEYGSVYPTCLCAETARLITDRIEQLEAWTKPVVEGEVCVGSRR